MNYKKMWETLKSHLKHRNETFTKKEYLLEYMWQLEAENRGKLSRKLANSFHNYWQFSLKKEVNEHLC